MIKKKKEKGLLYLILLLTFSGIIGFIFGKLAGNSAENLDYYISNLENIILMKIHIISYMLLGFFIILTILTYIKGKKDFLLSVEREDDIYNEKFLNTSIILSNIGIYIDILIIGISGQSLYRLNVDILSAEVFNNELFTLFTNSLIYILALIFFAIFQKKIINTIKKVCSEKNGDPYDIHFQRDWINSMDEREKIETYYAGFKTFNFINYSILFLLAILAIISPYANVGLVSYFILFTLILVINLVYLYYSNKGKRGII